MITFFCLIVNVFCQKVWFFDKFVRNEVSGFCIHSNILKQEIRKILISIWLFSISNPFLLLKMAVEHKLPVKITVFEEIKRTQIASSHLTINRHNNRKLLSCCILTWLGLWSINLGYTKLVVACGTSNQGKTHFNYFFLQTRGPGPYPKLGTILVIKLKGF